MGQIKNIEITIPYTYFIIINLLLQKYMFRVALPHEVAAGALYKNIKKQYKMR